MDEDIEKVKYIDKMVDFFKAIEGIGRKYANRDSRIVDHSLFDTDYFNNVFLPVVKDLGHNITQTKFIPEIEKGRIQYIRRHIEYVIRQLDDVEETIDFCIEVVKNDGESEVE